MRTWHRLLRLACAAPAFAVVLLFWSAQAWAARSAVVLGDASGSAVLQSEPKPNALALTRLRNGDPITISNYPTNGYYKARTASGQIGWVAVTSVGDASLAVGNTPPAPPQTTVIPSSAQTPQALQAPQTSQAPKIAPSSQQELPETETIPYQDVQQTMGGAPENPVPVHRGPRLPFEIKAFGGVQLLQSPLALTQAGVTLPSSMPYFGAQIGVPLSDRIFLLLRLEHLSSQSSQAGYNFSLSAMPLTTGISYLFTSPASKVRLRGSILLGVAFGTELDATAVNDPAPNESVLSTQAFTEMLKLDFEVPVVRRFAFYGEGGYRFLSSSSIGPTNIVNGSSIFQQGGNTVPISLILSGFFAGGGLAFYL